MEVMLTEAEKLNAEFARLGPIAAIQSIAKLMTPPLFWYERTLPVGSRVRHSGSATLIFTGQAQLVITAAHVYDEYLADKRRNAEIVCQLGTSLFDPEVQLIDCDRRVDLATFRLAQPLPSYIVHTPPLAWPPPIPPSGARAMIGGHPGAFREESAERVHSGFTTFFTHVGSAGVTSISCELKIAKGRPYPDPEPIAPGTHLGGLSGGPLLLVREEPVLTWHAVGITVECHDEMEILVARPLALVDEFGHIQRGLV